MIMVLATSLEAKYSNIEPWRSCCRRSAFPRVDCAALAARAKPLACVELLEERRKVAHDTLQLHLHPVQGVVTFLAVPLEAVFDALGSGALDDEADAAGFGALWRMPQVRRQKEDRAFLQIESPGLAVLHDIEKGVALHLIEEFLRMDRRGN